MFVSQVLFETDLAHEEQVRTIMKAKLAGLEGVEGLVAAECWKKEGKDTAGYCLVNKWQSKAHFTAWLRAEHQNKPSHGGEKQGERAPVKKAAVQYEVVEFCTKE